ncbi:hypothetical protein O6H91_01G097600 [Diphasiastrum complanatum]|uniref:Uncharacterized protein n=1 Tax=Diphasiastrum complanatum TaxID=34168 RepID=A0ACC2ETN5_DIPCM|nr:hypothetical protein O6H91_01G097600 [Diphasiastrum complanatum]
MGNYMACASYPNTQVHAASSIWSNKVKVVLPNGTVEEFQTPMLVAELMLENPLCFVSKSNSSNVTPKPAAMPADARLELGQLYFLLPARALQSRNRSPCSYGASFEKFNSLQKTGSRPENPKETKLQQQRLTLESLLHLMDESDESSLPGSDDACVISLELQMAYHKYLVTRNKMWKPKLETIGETCVHAQ